MTNVIRVWRARLVIETGSFTLELLLESMSRATAGTLVAFRRTTHVTELPATTVPGQVTEVGRTPRTATWSVLTAPFNAAVMLIRWS
jgi:hypothetical protein